MARCCEAGRAPRRACARATRVRTRAGNAPVARSQLGQGIVEASPNSPGRSCLLACASVSDAAWALAVGAGCSPRALGAVVATVALAATGAGADTAALAGGARQGAAASLGWTGGAAGSV